MSAQQGYRSGARPTTMMLFLFLATILVRVLSSPFKVSVESFANSIKVDQFIYTSIDVPRYAIGTELLLWTDSDLALRESDVNNVTRSVEDLNSVTVFFRFGGLPTLEKYDGKYRLMKLPSIISLEDPEPSAQTTLYIGFFGGALLHSDRHFTGESTSFLVGFSSLVITCSNELLRGRDCATTDILPLQFHSLATLGDTDTTTSNIATDNEVAKSLLIVGEKREFNAHVPKGVDLIHITLTFQDFSQSEICLQSNNSTIILTLALFAEIGDLDSSIRTYNIDQAQLCDSLNSESQPFRIFVERPLAGVWTLRAELFQIDDQSENNMAATKSLLSSTVGDRIRVRSTGDNLQHRLIATTKHHSYLGIAKESIQNKDKKMKSEKSASTRSVSVQIRTKLFSCFSPTSNNGKHSPLNDLLVYRLCGNSSFPLVITQMKSERSSSSSTAGILSVKSNSSVQLSIPQFFPFSSSDTNAPQDSLSNESNGEDSIRSNDTKSNNSATVSSSLRRLELDGGRKETTATKFGHSAIFSSTFSPKNVLNVVGGMLQLQLKVTKPDGNKQSLAELVAEVEFVVSIRYGGLPKYPLPVYYTDDGEEGSDSNAMAIKHEILAESPNSYSLISSNAKVILSNGNRINSDGSADGGEEGDGVEQRKILRRRLSNSDGVRTNDELLFLWVMDKPLLPPLFDTELGDVYVRVDIIRTAASPTTMPTIAPTMKPTVKPSSVLSSIPSILPTPTPAPSSLATAIPSLFSSASNTPTTAPTTLSEPRTESPSGVPSSTEFTSEAPTVEISTESPVAKIVTDRSTESPTVTSTEAVSNSTSRRVLIPHDYLTIDSLRAQSNSTGQSIVDQKNKTSTINTSTEKSSNRNNIQVSLTLSFSYCGHDLCENGGICTTQTGDISAAVCECKYPWAGAHCEILSVNYGSYILQVVTLVASNGFMLFGVLYAFFWADVPVLGTVLLTAAPASAFYHLCDVDLYCLFSLPFQSLQVLDVLFSSCGMIAVILYYCPLHRDTYSALVLLSVGLLIPPVVANPTNPFIVVAVIGSCAAFLILSWIFYRNRCFSRSRNIFAGAGDSFRRAPVSDSFSKRGGKEIELSKLIRQTEYSLVQSSPNRDDSREEGDDGDNPTDDNEGEVGRLNSSSASSTVDAIASAIRSGQVSTKVKASTVHFLKELRLTLIGIFLASTGLACFALQGNDNYWVVHSLWHAFIMTSAFFFLLGRGGFMKYMGADEE